MSWVSVNTSRGHEEGISASFVGLLACRAAHALASDYAAALGVSFAYAPVSNAQSSHAA